MHSSGKVLAVAFAVLLAASAAAAQVPEFPDVTVQTQTGETVRFSELLRGRAVAINFVFTTCTTVCPLMGASFGRVQELLGDRAKDVTLISISIDPETDTPERLAEWSRRFHARPGWTLVTGAQADIDALQKAVGVFTADAASHSPTVVVGDAASGVWKRVDGLAPPSKIVAIIDAVTSSPRQAAQR